MQELFLVKQNTLVNKKNHDILSGHEVFYWYDNINNSRDRTSGKLAMIILEKIKAMVSFAKCIYCKLQICKVHKRNSK